MRNRIWTVVEHLRQMETALTIGDAQLAIDKSRSFAENVSPENIEAGDCFRWCLVYLILAGAT